MSAVELTADQFIPMYSDLDVKCFYKDVSLPWQTTAGQSLSAFVKAFYKNGVLEKVGICESDKKFSADDSFSDQEMTEFNPYRPISLVPVEIIKPWGKEIWFTGIEERGISKVVQKDGDSPINISTLFKTLGSVISSVPNSDPLLLKILSPNSDPLSGSLYYEVHEEKEEVYFVTDVSEAYSDSIGRMKFGISREKLEAFGLDPNIFKREMRLAFKEYEAVRNDVEVQFDQFRKVDGIGDKDPIDSDQLNDFYSRLSPELREREKIAQARAEEFVGWIPVRVGDVIKVEKNVPHSLQFGVEVVEFQTPVYERKIISFNQKVLTQESWDSEDGIDLIDLSKKFVRPSGIINFPDFRVGYVSEAGQEVLESEMVVYNLDNSNFPTGALFFPKGMKKDPESLLENKMLFASRR